VRGAPTAAIELLERALREPPMQGSRVSVLQELAEATARANAPRAEEYLRAALAAAEGARAAAISLTLGRFLVRAGRGADASEVLQSGLPVARREDRELALHIQAELIAALRTEPGQVAPALGRGHLHPELRGETPGERILLASLAFEAGAAGVPSAVVRSLSQRALAGGRLIQEESSEALIVYFAIAGLHYNDDWQLALRHLDAALEDARLRGSPAG
jgi:hypothetical protein